MNAADPATAEPIVRLRGLHVYHGTTHAVRGIDLDVQRGDVVGLIGPDGAGKTSTLRVVAGLAPATSGEAYAFSQPIWPQRRRLHRRLGYLAQRFALYGDLTVEENLRFFSLLLGVGGWQARAAMLLERVGLLPFRERPADQLSGGMKQKLALACSLVHAPELLILDEPTAGVDPVSRREFWRLLAELVADGLTLLVATPYMEEAERCSRVVLVHEGRLLADASPTRLRSLVPGTIVDIAGSPRPLLAATLRRLPYVLDVQPFAARYHARLADPAPDLATLRAHLVAAGVLVEELHRAPTTIEDTFLYLTGAAGQPGTEAA